jgi:hypothetical protein
VKKGDAKRAWLAWLALPEVARVAIILFLLWLLGMCAGCAQLQQPRVDADVLYQDEIACRLNAHRLPGCVWGVELFIGWKF